MVYEVVMVLNPTKKDGDAGGAAKILLGPKAVVAKDEKSAQMIAARDLKEDVDWSRVEVLVRPFSR